MNRQNNLSNYFTEDVLKQIRTMTNDEMNGTLKELEQSVFWIPILKYLQSRMSIAQNSLYTLDPFKDQTAIARTQGVLLGMVDLQEMVIMLNNKDKEVENENEKS
jgi:hypothetical protein